MLVITVLPSLPSKGETMIDLVRANLPYVGVVLGVLLPTILFFAHEASTLKSNRRTY